jgi:hypothetical protein
MVRWRILDKINVHKIYNLQFFYGHSYGSWNIIKQKKNEFKKKYGCGFF